MRYKYKFTQMDYSFMNQLSNRLKVNQDEFQTIWSQMINSPNRVTQCNYTQLRKPHTKCDRPAIPMYLRCGKHFSKSKLSPTQKGISQCGMVSTKTKNDRKKNEQSNQINQNEQSTQTTSTHPFSISSRQEFRQVIVSISQMNEQEIETECQKYGVVIPVPGPLVSHAEYAQQKRYALVRYIEKQLPSKIFGKTNPYLYVINGIRIKYSAQSNIFYHTQYYSEQRLLQVRSFNDLTIIGVVDESECVHPIDGQYLDVIWKNKWNFDETNITEYARERILDVGA